MIVLDASVLLKWLLPEEESDEALRYRVAHEKGDEHIVVPALLLYEVANVLRLQASVTGEALYELFQILDDLEMTILHLSFAELAEAVHYSRNKNISVYDASYIVLAKRLGCDFITADSKLVQAVAEEKVRLLS